MITLRKYQQDAVQLLREEFKKGHKRIILCQPTGAGKSVVFSYMIHEAFLRGKKILCLTDRIELFNQTLSHIGRTGISPQIIVANTKTISPEAKVTIAMCETIKRRIAKGKLINYNPDLIIIDECHRANFFSILNLFESSLTIGCSATPSHKSLHLYYSSIVSNVQVSDLIKQGYLCRARSFQMQDSFDDVEVKGGEFEEKSLFNHFDRRKLYDGVVEKYLEKTPDTKALVFNVSIEHAKKMNKAFNDAGIRSECVTSETQPEERKRIFSAFRDGLFPVLNNCSIATQGLDIPSIQTIIMNRATLSVALFLQCIGRGSRPTETKKEFIILDFGMNFTRHGLYDEERKWSLDPPKAKKKGIAPVKNCPRCSAMLPARAIKCEFCGYIFPLPAQSALKDGVLVEVASDNNPFEGRKISELSLQELVKLSKTKKIKAPYIWRVIRAKGYDAVQNYGWLMGYKNGWAFNQQKELNDCSFRDRIL